MKKVVSLLFCALIVACSTFKNSDNLLIECLYSTQDSSFTASIYNDSSENIILPCFTAQKGYLLTDNCYNIEEDTLILTFNDSTLYCQKTLNAARNSLLSNEISPGNSKLINFRIPELHSNKIKFIRYIDYNNNILTIIKAH